MSISRHIKILGLAVFAVFAFSGVLAASAFAEQATWLVGGLEPPVGGSPVKAEKVEVLLVDMTEKVGVLCTGTQEGTVGPGALDKVTKVTVSSCVADEGLCPFPKASAVHLPWHTELGELTSENGPFEDFILKEVGVTGEPGWDVECAGILDECTGNGTVFLTGLLAESPMDVDGEFTAASPATNCTRGGTGAGLITSDSAFLLVSTEGLNLEIM